MQVSVIIPTHNRAATLPRAIESVLQQSRPANEILIVDDGSDDDSRALVTQQFPQCRYLHQQNRGVSSARNLGISASKGEWIALLDSDDAWLPQKLEQQLARVEAQAGKRLCHTEEIWIRNGVRVNAMKKHQKQGGRIFGNCLPMCVISPSSALLHRSLFDEVGLFDETLPACEDYDLWLRICAHEAVLFLEQPLIVKYGGHADQLSRRHWGMDRFRIQALQKIIDSGQLSAEDYQAAVEILVQKALIFAHGAEKRGHHERAEHYRRIARHHQKMGIHSQ
ncbi:glycosyltransferase family 2 protein [endosymbiont of Ridgeia piscesae]|jgi:glycosyltransferase involved in cell wall biosynthesis|uniref:Glycosyl transferase family 2 n=1 Tax=endosymbiont of Ridgeia piscesae TaxID=54398 RepID=A0A0T5YXG7_9GAMM|nr:glycosyltransferase family A protein [endosymbiont of Ridgeia piscesae]KRT54910.1 Glycosyl transferase family 2 [endosymbiont of Ridgeia piscesae]KRT60025.1 Glycosyl transferase family 2 [endosymbiont of Ridgeia piscesae]